MKHTDEQLTQRFLSGNEKALGKPDDSGVINAELIRIFNNNPNPQPQN